MADLGEGYGAYSMGDDLALLDVISSANVACGFHAGDPIIMERVVKACVERGVSIGAHPGFYDLRGFGRRTIAASPDEIRTDIIYQVGALGAFAQSHGTDLSHVTPHGRLGNLAIESLEYAEPVAEAIAGLPVRLPVATLEGHLARLARERDLDVAIIGFADRAYHKNGTLVSRREPGAVLHDPVAIAERVVRMATEHVVETIEGDTLAIRCDSILVHGDTPRAVEIAQHVRASLEGAGVTVVPLPTVLASRRDAR